MRGLLLATAGLVAWGVFVAIGLSRAETNIEDFFPWLPDDTPARRNYISFIEQFGADDTLIVSWEGCRLGDPRIARLSDALLTQDSEYIRGVTTAESLIARLTAPPSRWTRDAVARRLQNILIGPDGQTTAVFVHLNQAGMRDRRHSVARVIDEAKRCCQLSRDELRLGGHPYVGYYSAIQTRDAIVQLSIPVAIVSTLLAWGCLRKRRLMLLTLACGGAAALTSLALVPWAGYRVNGLLSALPSLIYVITTSGVIHIVNYSLTLRRQDRELGRTTSPAAHAAEVRRLAWRACLLSSTSTALGTASLIWSDFPAIREFGMFGTVSVGLTLLIHLGLLPLSLGWVFPEDASTVSYNPFAAPFARLFQILVRFRGAIIATALAATAVLVWPLTRLEGRFTIDRMFRPGSEFVTNINWLEHRVGPIDATEVLVRFPADSHAGFFRRLRRIQMLEMELAQVPGVTSTFSAASFAPEPHANAGLNLLQLALLRRSLEQRRDEFLSGSHLAEQGGIETWRLTLRSRLFGGLPRDELMRGIRARTADVLRSWERQDSASELTANAPTPDIIFTGGSEIFYETQHDVLVDFAESLLLAFALISLMMMLAVRNIRGGLLAMFPNLVPCVAVFGLLGWVDRGIDIGMTVAGCIALGIAVDNTSHLLMLYREHRRESLHRLEALRLTYAQSSTAVFQTSLICGLSMLPYSFAAMLYLSRFGLLMSALMGVAMLCDLLLTPALIATRAGRVFEWGIAPAASSDTSS